MVDSRISLTSTKKKAKSETTMGINGADQPMEVEGEYHSCIGKAKSRKKCIRDAERTRHSSEERNARERKRVKMVNVGFDLLHKKIPLLSPIRKVSKLQILRGAKSYIMQLEELLLEHNASASPASAEVSKVPVSLAETVDGGYMNLYDSETKVPSELLHSSENDNKQKLLTISKDVKKTTLSGKPLQVVIIESIQEPNTPMAFLKTEQQLTTVENRLDTH
ncbi:ATOH7 protein, partial [Polypterus senegalus]